MARIRETIQTEKIEMRTLQEDGKGDRVIITPSYFHYIPFGEHKGIRLTWFKMRAMIDEIKLHSVRVPKRTRETTRGRSEVRNGSGGETVYINPGRSE